jgi:aldehyde:ferredoxin oxidoreductase
MPMSLYGYAGKILRVDLTTGKITEEKTSEELTRRFVGGSGFGARFLYDEVKPETEWHSPDNRLIIMPGPLAGTKIAGSATFSVISKGPMTNLAGTSQANGNLGAFLKFSGIDGIIIQGKSPEWVYLVVKNGVAELREATRHLGRDTLDTEDLIKQELGEGNRYSVFSIGPAGENLVRYAVICGDKGHVVSKNGMGAVMGSKKLKAIAAHRGENRIEVYDSNGLLNLRKRLFEHARDFAGGSLSKWGTARSLDVLRGIGQLPVRNLTTNVYPEDPQINTSYIRTHYELKPKPCFACGMKHCHWIRVTEGTYAGQEGEEPDYECIAATGPAIGNHDMGAVVMLSDLIDRLGVDANEVGWLIGWVMECYDRGILSKKQLDGLDMSWGNVEAVKEMLLKISRREGIGQLLAEGVKRASEEIGGEAVNMGVYSMKGATPRGHDHRARWGEMLDTCVSGTSTIEATFAGAPTERFGWPPVGISFSPWEVALANARINGWFVFLDSLVICYFCAIDPNLVTATANAVTGWDLRPEDAITVGKRTVNLLRVFNIRHGLDIATEAPSPRYGSTPTDGPAKGKSIMAHWKWMVKCYYEAMGWDKETGKPCSYTLQHLGLDDLIEDL